jgi:drug/metabolite transporter (DMT)-like permease
MPPWSLAALAAALCFALHYLTLRAASGRIGDGLGALCIEAIAALGLLALYLTRITPRGPTTTPGLVWSAASGLCISGAMALLFSALRLGGPVSGTGTIALGGGVTLAALAAPLLFDEAFTLRRAIGVLLGFAAMAILATEKS